MVVCLYMSALSLTGDLSRGVPRLSPSLSWDWLQPPCHPQLMDGCSLNMLFKVEKAEPIKSTSAVTVHCPVQEMYLYRMKQARNTRRDRSVTVEIKGQLILFTVI